MAHTLPHTKVENNSVEASSPEQQQQQQLVEEEPESTNPVSSAMDQLKWIFDLCDQDHDGLITVEEFRSLGQHYLGAVSQVSLFLFLSLSLSLCTFLLCLVRLDFCIVCLVS